MNRIWLVHILIFSASLLTFSQESLPAKSSMFHKHLVPYSVDGKLLTGCRLRSVEWRGGNRVISQLNQPGDMRIPQVPEGDYQVSYICGDRLYYDEHVYMREDDKIVLLVDRSGGDQVKFRSGYEQGMRLTWQRSEEPQGNRDFVRWARLSHLIDAESWIREVNVGESELVFPAKPGIFLLAFSSSRDTVCIAVINIVSFASKVAVSDQSDCQLKHPDGLQVVGMVEADPRR